MLGQLQRSSSWTGRVVVVVVALLGSQLHAGGAPERALSQPGVALVVGSLMGVMMLAIVIARLIGRNFGLIRSDRQAVGALIVMMASKIAIARLLLT
jgi:hypothetical protein